jgi:hypothetical protein
MKKSSENLNQLNIPVRFEVQPKEEISLIGFLFNCYGILLEWQYVRDNVLQFETREMETRELRLFIAPAMDKNIEKVSTIEALEMYKPYEPILQTTREGSIDILPVPGYISQFWPFCTCRVTGKVSKWFHVGFNWDDRPVCNARVHICEVDSIWYWIYKIPDYIIAKIPDAILKPEEVIKHPIPIPDPPPFFENEVRTFAQQQQQQTIFKTSSVESKQLEITSQLPEISAEIKQNLASGNLNLIRQTIASNYAILHPWFCLWPWWWPYFYRCTERAVVYTDANGRFDTNIFYWCFGDQPDIYVWVEYFINGAWITVYNPPVPCNTLWDYACGTDINIHVSDERVPGDCCCNCPIPGELVWIKSVNGTSVAHINQQNILQAPPNQSVPYNRIGLTDAAAIYDPWFLPTSVGDYKRPFGGSSSLYMGFGSDLPNAGIYYYRWSYKQIADAQLNPVADNYKPLEAIGGVVNKGYEFTYIDSNNDTQFGANSVKLGPFTVGANDNLYIIPPEQPDMAPFNVPETDPQWHQPTYNTITMSYDSSQLKRGNSNMLGGDGLYEFKLELFDQAGNLLTNIPKATFKIPDYNDANFSVNAPDILLENATLTTANAFNMLMRIDNSQCDADIFTVKVNGAPASLDCCGFVKYKHNGVEADLELSFLATHPNNFAVFAFGVQRGTCSDPAMSALTDANGMVIDSANGYLLSGGIYDKHFTPAQLLGSCYHHGNGKAAFAETLSVAAMATDGTFRLSGKDKSDIAAFALEP